MLGQSDGTPGQRFRLQNAPLLSRRPDETLVVQEANKPPELWQEVDNFAESSSFDRHFTLDSVSGELRLGPAVRQADGTMQRYGSVPPRQATLLFQRYRAGGGLAGNVLAGNLNTLKTSIPYIARVSNRQPAWGGLDAESLMSAMMRAPALLRSRDRAVSEADFEFLARQALPAAIGRVKCLQPRPSEAGRVAPGQVYVLVIPHVPNPAGYLAPEQLVFPKEAVAALQSYLDQRRLLTVRLDVRDPVYRWVAVKVQLRPVPGAAGDTLRAEVLARLYRFLNPLTGGPDSLNPGMRRPEDQGWPFGRELFASDVYQALQGQANVQFVRGLQLYATTPGGGPQGQPIESLELVAHGVVASGRHVVEFV
jgi:predicted phage baseplate assembly protein